jgi:uncharacterized membrane protein
MLRQTVISPPGQGIRRLVIGALTAAALLPLGHPLAAQTMSADPRQSSQAPAAAPEQQSFRDKARDELHDWQRKIDDFNHRTETSGRAEAKEARASLDQAWSNVETQSRRLETASAADWNDSKIAYQRAVQDLSERWGKVTQSTK